MCGLFSSYDEEDDAKDICTSMSFKIRKIRFQFFYLLIY